MVQVLTLKACDKNKANEGMGVYSRWAYFRVGTV